MDQLPISLTLRNRLVVVAGGGDGAAAKARLATAAGAGVVFIAPVLGAEAAEQVSAGLARHVPREFQENDAGGAFLLFVATGVDAEDRRVAGTARSGCALINVVDRPEISTFSMPAVVDRGQAVIGISTGGAAPAAAAHVRSLVEAALPKRLDALVRFAGSFRNAVRARVPPGSARSRFWTGVLSGPIAAEVLEGREDAARSQMMRRLNGADAVAGEGVVHLVGAGPGDAELLTVRAMRLLQAADSVVYDRLVSPSVLDYARRDSERVYVGKESSKHAVPQERIHALLVARARAGLRVVRLKGGDPFVFGRGGEELDALRGAGIAVQVVPGISAALACAAAAGVPLTHRDLADSVTLVSGHSRDGAEDPDWTSLARARHTIVVYMGVANVGRIAARLMDGGLAPSTPAAVIQDGTRPEQRVFGCRLDGLAGLVVRHGVQPPAMLVIGDVAAYALERAAALASERAATG